MGQLFPNNTFVYNGQTYFFAASIYTSTEKYFSTHGLNSEDCVSFEYRNQINSLTIMGVLTYIDRTGIVDKYLEKPYVRSSITFAAIKTTTEDDGIDVRELDEDQKIDIEFLVTKIEIIERNGKNITYSIHMVSANWLNLMSTINYTNYGKRPEQIFKIIKNILKQAELEVDDETFDLVKSEVKLNYITNGNDTVISAIKYLLSKMLYYKKFDESWKFIYYDEQKNKYRLFDFTKLETCNGHRLFIMSLFNSRVEEMFQIQPMDLNTANSFTNAQVFTTGFGFKRTDYDYQHNIFVNDKVKNEDIVNSRNKSYVDFSPPYFQKYEKLYDSSLDFTHKVTYWNDNQLMSRYNNLSRTFCENNSLIIDCAGEITRKPSDLVQISLDRDVQGLSDEDPENEDDTKHRYAGFEGAWITSRVHNIVDLQNSTFRSRIFVFRNYITDTIEKTAKE